LEVVVVEAGVVGGGAALLDCSSSPPDFRSRRCHSLPSSPLFPSLNWRGRGLRCARVGYTPAISYARASPLSLPACLASAPSRAPFPRVFPASARLSTRVVPVQRHGDAFLHEVTPYARKSWRAGRPDSEIARTTRRCLGDAIKTM